MPDQNSQAIVEELLPEATRRLIRTADALADEAYAEPSGLPDWTRGHVLAHLALNAEGLAGALGGIVEGERVPMYASQEARDSDIAELAAAGPSVIRDPAARRDHRPGRRARRPARRPAGTPRSTGCRAAAPSPPATCPAMRLREVEIHHADLAAGYTRADWPPAFVVLLLDAMSRRASRPTVLPCARHRPRPHLALRRGRPDRHRHRRRPGLVAHRPRRRATD